MANTRTCTHIKVTGVRCGSPALTGESFCYFHQNVHRGVRKPPQARLHPIALIEDEESIQAALMEVINALMRNTIDLKRATLILRALHIAVKNAARVKFGISANSMVREIPDYPEPERPPEPKKYTREEIEAIKVQMWSDYRKEQAEKAAEAAAQPAATPPHVATAASAVQATPSNAKGSVPAAAVLPAGTTPNVGTAAIGCPATLSNAKGSANVGTDPLIRPATLSGAKESAPAAATKSTPASTTAPTARPAAPPLPPRKPAASTTTAQAPKERKNAAHAVRHG